MKGIGFFLGFFLIGFVTLRMIQPSGIVFYQGMILALATVVAFIFSRRKNVDVGKDSLLLFLILYAFVFTIPTTVDRAYSVRMLLRIDASPQGLTRDDIHKMYVQGFLAEGGADKRIREQIATGSIVEQEGRLRATSTGAAIAAAFRFAQTLFASDQNR